MKLMSLGALNGNCTRFGAVSGDGLPREKYRRGREILCCLVENWTEEVE